MKGPKSVKSVPWVDLSYSDNYYIRQEILRYAVFVGWFVRSYVHSGASIPPTTMAFFPQSHVYPLLPPAPFRLPTPANIFWTFYTQFCANLCAFSVNFGSWQSGIITAENK